MNKIVMLSLIILLSGCKNTFLLRDNKKFTCLYKYEDMYNVAHPDEANIEGLQSFNEFKKTDLFFKLEGIAKRNKTICGDLNITECISSKDTNAISYFKPEECTDSLKAILGDDFCNTLQNNILDVVESIKRESLSGIIYFSHGRYEVEFPYFNYIPTKGFIGTPLEVKVRNIFNSGVHI